MLKELTSRAALLACALLRVLALHVVQVLGTQPARPLVPSLRAQRLLLPCRARQSPSVKGSMHTASRCIRVDEEAVRARSLCWGGGDVKFGQKGVVATHVHSETTSGRATEC